MSLYVCACALMQAHLSLYVIRVAYISRDEGFFLSGGNGTVATLPINLTLHTPISRVPLGGEGSNMSQSQAMIEVNKNRQDVGRLATCTLVLNLSMSNEE